MTAKQYQDFIIPRLLEKLCDLEICNEWPAFSGLNYQYSPRVDIAVGPYSIVPGQNQTEEYNRILSNEGIKQLLRNAYDMHVQNIGAEWLNEISIPDFDYLTMKNQNARCFLAIEIENTSTKSILWEVW
jgi:hypothetical protein